MKIMPLRYVTDVAASERFYAALGLSPDVRSRTGNWSELGGGGVLALHTAGAADPPRTGTDLVLSLLAEEPLEDVAARLTASGYAHSGVVDESFGRLLTATDPDGLEVQVNEHDESLYT